MNALNLIVQSAVSELRCRQTFGSTLTLSVPPSLSLCPMMETNENPETSVFNSILTLLIYQDLSDYNINIIFSLLSPFPSHLILLFLSRASVLYFCFFLPFLSFFFPSFLYTQNNFLCLRCLIAFFTVVKTCFCCSE